MVYWKSWLTKVYLKCAVRLYRFLSYKPYKWRQDCFKTLSKYWFIVLAHGAEPLTFKTILSYNLTRSKLCKYPRCF